MPPHASLWKSVLLSLLLSPFAWGADPDRDWQANAVLDDVTTWTIADVGAVQGAHVHDGKLYLYGDLFSAKPRVGVIREYNFDLEPTGRQLWLRKGDDPLITHPTGLAIHPKYGAFLGDTVDGEGIIHRFDWEQAWEDGDLSQAAKQRIEDDASVNGTRPLLVTLDAKQYLATADYGDQNNQVRLYDIERLVREGRSSAPGVVAHRFACGPFNQNLAWDEERGELTCVQNVVGGRGWRLDVIDLARAVDEESANVTGVRVRRWIFPPHTELEGYQRLPDGRHLFAVVYGKDNILAGTARPIDPRRTPKGTRSPK
ncbi:hypothetical protein Pan216_35570 [Planctomycetes bacterium Pan216]|uniref:Phytase-like domain-containing protein n=1 Tax=Kolteria novifilia TaxID=2527975 RepID=A0A518B6S6_9BACT|nr:hypothetical protein Pan216_35570 [Planctomycetes bacterium Pan216]